MVEMPKEVIAALSDMHAVKMVGTVDEKGVPNTAIIATVAPFDEKTICFADLRLGKTKENLNRSKKLTVTVLKQNLESYQIRCRLESYEERSERANAIAEGVYTKIKMQARGVVFGEVEEVYSASLSNPGEKLA